GSGQASSGNGARCHPAFDKDHRERNENERRRRHNDDRSKQDGLLILREGRIIDANERFQGLYGWKLAGLAGKAHSVVLTAIQGTGQNRPSKTLLNT
ncbi:hypothetical protein, partial [Rhizobium leguminosarum]|uniref:hypothetical protein n=1 Tax=Rhizobium leguminosarum TaxID=384 RepID=UPI003F9AAB5F